MKLLVVAASVAPFLAVLSNARYLYKKDNSLAVIEFPIQRQIPAAASEDILNRRAEGSSKVLSTSARRDVRSTPIDFSG